jgi:hypothetical protein
MNCPYIIMKPGWILFQVDCLLQKIDHNLHSVK